MRKVLVFLAFLFLLQWGTSQKLVEKTLNRPETKYLQIDGDNCFQIMMDTHQSHLLKVEAIIEEEYSKDLAINIEENGKNIGISATVIPSFQETNVKLNALEEVSLVLSITVPEYMAVSLTGTTTNVQAKGIYTNLSISLSDGNCSLQKISEKVSVRTHTGEIEVKEAKGSISAKSTYGKVIKGNIPNGDEIYLLHSNEGNIIVNGNNG